MVIVSCNVIVNSRALRNILYFNSEFILANIVIVSSNVIVNSRAFAESLLRKFSYGRFKQLPSCILIHHCLFRVFS